MNHPQQNSSNYFKPQVLEFKPRSRKKAVKKALGVMLGAFAVVTALIVANHLLTWLLRLIDSTNSVGFSIAAIFLMLCASAYLWITLPKRERL